MQSVVAAKLGSREEFKPETEEERATRVECMRRKAAKVSNRLNKLKRLGAANGRVGVQIVFPRGYHRDHLQKMISLIGNARLFVADPGVMRQVNTVLCSEKDRGHEHHIFKFPVSFSAVSFGQTMKLMEGVAPFLEDIRTFPIPVLVSP